MNDENVNAVGPIPEMPQEIESHSTSISEDWPEYTTDCLCIMGQANMGHVINESCKVAESPVAFISDPSEPTLDEVGDIINVSRGRGRPPKLDEDLVDPESAGRKRAAAKVKVKNVKCEWTYLKHAGGGVNPIMGCIGYPASALHHGPDKSTLNNSRPEDVGAGEPYNLHNICNFCHARWHVVNDEYFGSNGALDRPKDNSTWVPIVPYKEHDPNTTVEPAVGMMEELGRLKVEKAKGIDYSVEDKSLT